MYTKQPAILAPRSARTEATVSVIGRPLGSPVLLARAVLVLAICYTVIAVSDVLALQVRNGIIAAVLGSNLLGLWALRRADGWRIRWLVTVLDILAVSSVIWLVGSPGSDFFLAYLLVLALAVASVGTLAASVTSLVVALVYGGLLYHQLGSEVWLDSQYVVRIGFLFAVGFFFGLIANEARRQRQRADEIGEQLHQVATHAKSLARDKYRLKALSEIGRLGLSVSSTSAHKVLFEISRRVQKGMGVDRCSLVVFGGDRNQKSYVAASGDDDSVEVRLLDVDHYPELQATIASGGITEVHPRQPLQLWNQILEFLPDVSPFNSFLVVPIKAADEVFGAYYIRDRDPARRFSEEERDFCWAAALMAASFIRGRDLVDQLRRQSRVDGLTGLLNFQAFTEAMDAELVRADNVTATPYTLVVIDMDNLKEINDLHGHASGNRALIELGRRLREALPTAVAMCRYGGDEFVALVPGDCCNTVERINTLLNGMTAMDWDAPFDLRASAGVAEYPSVAQNSEALLEAADQAMYLAKGGGGHRVRVANGEMDSGEIYDAVVSVQTRRIMPHIRETFSAQLRELQRQVILGLDAPIVREAITALMDAVESQDPLSREHAVGVALLCRDVAQRMRFNAGDVRGIEVAGHLHDVGKINIPPEILTKQGPLSEDERRIVQCAPSEGAAILAALPGLRQVATLVQTYQERWDGSGYPSGLVGDQIPLGAQIVGICDVYNALVSPRAQRSPIQPHRARAIIEQEIGRRWNPLVAEAFLDMLAERSDALVAGEDSATEDRGQGGQRQRRQTA